MNAKREWIIGIASVLVIALCVCGWLQERDARLRAESTQAGQQEVFAAAQRSIDAAKADQVKVANDLKARIATLETQKSQPITPNQFVVDMGKLIPALPKPVTVVQTPATTEVVDGKTVQIPSAPAVQIPAEDLQAIKAYKLSCDETDARLHACDLTGADLRDQLAGMQTQLQATAKERDAWKAASKGGAWWRRTLTAGKWLVVGGSVGYLAARKW